MTSFLSLTAHCIFPNFDTQVVLFAQPFTERHTAVNINDTIDNMINEYKIPKHKIHAIVHDSASNMVKGVKDSQYNSLACFTHTTQLALNDCIFEQPSVKTLEQKCKKIYSHFNTSYVAMSRLHGIQKELGHKELVPLNNNLTRWDSTFIMFERTLQLKTDIIVFTSRYNGLNVEITPHEWITMSKLLELLGLFHSITKSMSNRYAHSGEIIPFVKILKHYVNDELTQEKLTGLHTTLKALSESFNRRFSKYLSNDNCILASYLDPRYKHSVFESSKRT